MRYGHVYFVDLTNPVRGIHHGKVWAWAHLGPDPFGPRAHWAQGPLGPGPIGPVWDQGPFGSRAHWAQGPFGPRSCLGPGPA